MRLRCETCNAVIRLRTVGPLVGLGPDAELEFQATTDSLRRDELQGFKIALALTRRERWLNGNSTVCREFDEVGVGKVEVVAGDTARKVIAEAEREVETIEARVGKRIQVACPKGPVIEPRLVFNLRQEGACDTSNSVGRSFHYGCGEMESAQRIIAELHAVGEFKESVDEPTRIDACHKNCGIVVISARNEGGGFHLLDCRQCSKACRE